MKILCKKVIAYCYNHILIDFILPTLCLTQQNKEITHIWVKPWHPKQEMVKSGKLPYIFFDLCDYFLSEYTIVLDKIYQPANKQLMNHYLFVDVNQFTKDHKKNMIETYFSKNFEIVKNNKEFLKLFREKFGLSKDGAVHNCQNLVVHIDRANKTVVQKANTLNSKSYNVETGMNRKKNIINEEEYEKCLIEFCEKNNLVYKKVLFDNMSIPEKIELMLQTKILIGVHGGGLVNQIFMTPGTHAIEMYCNHYFSTMFTRLTSFSGTQHHRLNCNKESHHDGIDYNVDLMVDLNGLKKLLDGLISKI